MIDYYLGITQFMLENCMRIGSFNYLSDIYFMLKRGERLQREVD